MTKMTQHGSIPQIIKTEQILDEAKEPWLRIYVDGKLERGFRGEGSIQKAVDEIVFWVDSDTVIGFSIDGVKYELPSLVTYRYWGMVDDVDKLKEHLEYWVDFHKAFYSSL